MRTTLTLDNDVADLARAIAEKTGRAFKEVINEALRTFPVPMPERLSSDDGNHNHLKH